MGFAMFVVLIASLIVSNVRSIVDMKTVNNVSEETEEDYYDDFETL